jgi:DNA-directed RNA polymerase omega subunit
VGACGWSGIKERAQAGFRVTHAEISAWQEQKYLMHVMDKSSSDGLKDTVADEWPGIDSKFRLIVVAALRSKQLLRGSAPRIDADPLRRRNTSIALEEVKQGLVPFVNSDKD